ncbi:MAG: hypothetical protein ACYTAS_10680 [Planctomycetota bacterium]
MDEKEKAKQDAYVERLKARQDELRREMKAAVHSWYRCQEDSETGLDGQLLPIEHAILLEVTSSPTQLTLTELAARIAKDVRTTKKYLQNLVDLGLIDWPGPKQHMSITPKGKSFYVS